MLPLYAYAAISMRFYEFSPIAYQTLFDHVRDPIFVLDQEERIVCVNKSAQELLAAVNVSLSDASCGTISPRPATLSGKPVNWI